MGRGASIVLIVFFLQIVDVAPSVGTVVRSDLSCKYFLVKTSRGLAILRPSGGDDPPREGQVLAGDFETAGTHDIYNCKEAYRFPVFIRGENNLIALMDNQNSSWKGDDFFLSEKVALARLKTYCQPPEDSRSEPAFRQSSADSGDQPNIRDSPRKVFLSTCTVEVGPDRCNRFLAKTPRGITLLSREGGAAPKEGQTLIGDFEAGTRQEVFNCSDYSELDTLVGPKNFGSLQEALLKRQEECDLDPTRVVAVYSAIFFWLGAMVSWAARAFSRSRRRALPPDVVSWTDTAMSAKLSVMMSSGYNSLCEDGEFTVLLLGPGAAKPGHPESQREAIWRKREQLRSALLSRKFTVIYGEDLTDVGVKESQEHLNPLLKEKIVAAQAHSIIVLAEGDGAVAELGSLAELPSICSRLVIAVHARKRFLIDSTVKQAHGHGAKIIEFNDRDIATCSLKARVLEEVLTVFQSFLSRKIGTRWVGNQ